MFLKKSSSNESHSTWQTPLKSMGSNKVVACYCGNLRTKYNPGVYLCRMFSSHFYTHRCHCTWFRFECNGSPIVFNVVCIQDFIEINGSYKSGGLLLQKPATKHNPRRPHTLLQLDRQWVSTHTVRGLVTLTTQVQFGSAQPSATEWRSELHYFGCHPLFYSKPHLCWKQYA